MEKGGLDIDQSILLRDSEESKGVVVLSGNLKVGS